MRKERSTTLIADFEETGNAKGWHFSIPSAYRLALDIQMTPRIVNGVSEDTWTQGESFNFSEGDLLYDTPLAYRGTWGEALRNIQHFIQIEQSTPPKLIGDEVQQGTVTFKLYSPNQKKNGIELISRHSCLQSQFVYFLKTGQLKTNDDNLVLIQKPGNLENHGEQIVLF